MKVCLSINGRSHACDARPGEVLLDTLRGLGYKGVKNGCLEGTCGVCTVLLDGLAAYSCLTFTAQAEGVAITTIEGIGTLDAPHPLQEAFVGAGAIQCGYCAPGMILAAKALLDRTPRPPTKEIKTALDGNLCRCTGYVKQIEAVRRASRGR